MKIEEILNKQVINGIEYYVYWVLGADEFTQALNENGVTHANVFKWANERSKKDKN